MPEPIVVAERFTYTYPDAEQPALAEIALELESGSFTLLAGESGCGKSTLLRAACGLVPHFHGGEASGDLSVGGMSVRDHGPGDLAEVCGTLFQDPESQVVMGGVRAEIALGLEHRGEPPAAVARAVEEAALALGIGHLLSRRADTLSGGELQRVALAAALAHRPRLLLLDEPTSQLDPVAGDELIWLLRRLNEEWGTTVLLTEHRLERCLPAADRVLALDEGRLVCDAPPADFLAWAADARPPLATPAARLFSLAGLTPLPASVKQAKTALSEAGLALEVPPPEQAAPAKLRRKRSDAALELRGVWHELENGPAILRGVDLRVEPGELVALMGRNGAGKSTLLRHAKGLIEPTRGKVRASGEVALLLQNPGDYLIHEHAREEAGEAALVSAGLAGRGQADPRDLSGGERQRLALEVVLSGGPCAVVCLDEPTRGMDRSRKEALALRLHELAQEGAAVIVATHDPEFAARLADRVLLMGEGELIADGPVADVLAGGWYFATEVARVLGGAGGALTPEQGAAVLTRELVS
jgi:energy-coupling factor transport system ATP-binding protein